MRERNYQSLIADRRHSLFGHICRLPENTPASQALQLSIEAHTGTPPAADWTARRVVHGEIGCSNWKKTLAYLLVLPGSRARSFDVKDAATLSWSSAAVSE